MLNRKIWIFIVLSLFFSQIAVISQENSVSPAEEPVRYQVVQQFKWKPSDKAAKYEVLIETMENENWVLEMAPVITKETTLALSLYPGKKRISITSLNKLGRRGKATPWTEFIVLDETQPYLYDDYLKKSKQWDSPLLQITRGANEKAEGLSSENGDPENSFFLKGKNIFLTETKFYMVPVDESSSGGAPYESFNKLRKTVNLKLVRRDFDKPGVVVEYNPEELYSGYYQIYAENPGNQKTSLDILVLANREPVFDLSQFEYFPNYDVRLLDTDKIKENGGVLKISGSGFTGDTRFALTPSSAGIPYPFATSKERIKSELTVSAINPLSETGDMELSFKLSASDVPPGYYNLTAENSMGKATVFLLVRNIERESLKASIESVTVGKGNKKDEMSFEIKGQNLSENCIWTLISQMSLYTGQSTRIPLNMFERKKNGTKVVLQGLKEKVTPGVYALLAETPEDTAVRFIEISEKNKGKVKDLSLQEENELFIRPENFVALTDDGNVVEETVEELVYTPTDYKYKKVYRTLFPYFEIDLNIANNVWGTQFDSPSNALSAGFSLEVLNLQAVHLGVRAAYNWDANFYNAEAFLRLSTTHEKFRPYLGFGVGVNLFDTKYCCPVDMAIGHLMKGSSEGDFARSVYAFADLGVCLFNFLDVRYSLHLSGADRIIGYDLFGDTHIFAGNYFYDDISVGVRIPYNDLKTKQKATRQILTISKKGPVCGTDYKLKKDIKRIVFANGITEISEFNDNYKLTSISVPDTVKIIGKDAFKNCYNLKEVILPYGVEEIKEGAFEGCRSMQKIVLPSSIKKVDSSAFSDWKDFQYIVYEWSRDDTRVRDLGDLPEKPNFSTVYDAVRTPFEKRNAFKLNCSNGDNYSNSREKGSIRRGQIEVDGVSYRTITLKTEVLSNPEIFNIGLTADDPMVCRYLENGDGITFHCVGDRNRYNIVIISEDGRTFFTHEFYAKEGDNVITIPFKYFVYDEYTSETYINLRKMKIGSITIAPWWEDVRTGKVNELTIYGMETIMEKKKK